METPRAPHEPLPGLSVGALGSIFQAIGALRNRQALLALLGCLVVGVLVAGLASLLGSFAAFLGSLLLLVAVGTGVNAAGVLQMDPLRGAPTRTLVDALVFGLLCIPKLILLGLVLFAIELAVFLVLAIVFLLCKIPFLGPLLYIVAFPASVVIAGLTVVGLLLCLVLALPAIWEGLTVTRAIAQTLAIARSRPVETVVLLLAVWLLCAVVGLIVFGILGTGLVPTIGLSASIIGGFDGMAPIAGVMQGGYAGDFGGGHAIAGLIGFGLLWAIAATLVGQVYLLGLCIVYLRVTEDLDVGSTEAALQRSFDDAKRRTAELGERARATAARAAASTRPAGTATGASSGVPDEPTSADARQWSRPASSPAPTSATARDESTAAPTRPEPTNAATGSEPASVATGTSLPAEEPATGPNAASSTPSMPCPRCAALCGADDLFCGACGQRLR